MKGEPPAMKKFILLYHGPATPPGSSHEGWAPWFSKIGDHLVDTGSGTKNGIVLHSDGSTSSPASPLNGYNIVQAENVEDAIRLVKDHLYPALGNGEYSIEIFVSPSSRSSSRK
jgi:hypothetical protein